MDVADPLIVVAGMHRSGTSLLVRMLADAGLFAGRDDDMMAANPRSNATGHWEILAVARLNDEVLAACGAHWAGPVEIDDAALVGLTDGPLGDRARELLDRELAGVAVVKDPRFSLTLPFWRHVLSDRVVVLVPWRHPDAVAASLEARNSFPRALGALLWDEYLLRAERNSRGLARRLVAHTDLLADPGETIAGVERFLSGHGVGALDVAAVAPADGTLVHHREAGELSAAHRARLRAFETDGVIDDGTGPDPELRRLVFGSVAPLANDRDRLRWEVHRLREVNRRHRSVGH